MVYTQSPSCLPYFTPLPSHAAVTHMDDRDPLEREAARLSRHISRGPQANNRRVVGALPPDPASRPSFTSSTIVLVEILPHD